jgi:hypothetical protein
MEAQTMWFHDLISGLFAQAQELGFCLFGGRPACSFLFRFLNAAG